MSKPAIAITVGDPSGIGPEIVKKAVSDKSVLRICKPVVIGASEKFAPGKHSKKTDSAAVSFLSKAVSLIKNGVASAVVTAPVSKSAFGKTGGGHTEFLAKKFHKNIKNVEMLMIAGNIRVLILTRHIPLKDVAKKISVRKIVSGTELACNFLKEKFRIKNPKIAVCCLNPHCGDGGLSGGEEREKIVPAIKILRKKGFDISGPLNCEAAFSRGKFDLIAAMYHDQAMVPLKLLNPESIVNVTAGLPFVRTSPGHGTAFDIAGKNKADPRPMIEAIKLACHLTKSEKKIQ